MTSRNCIFAIKPYKWNGLWVFDDPERDLVREPFVAGTDTMIDRATQHTPNSHDGFIAIFSAGYFPGAQSALKWLREEGGGNVYRWPEQAMEGWLCPALLKFIDPAPEKLFIQVRPAG